MNLGKLVAKLALGISLVAAPVYGCEGEASNSTPDFLCFQLFERANYCCKKVGAEFPEYCPSFLDDNDKQEFYNICEEGLEDPVKKKEMEQELSYGLCCRVITYYLNDEQISEPMCMDSGEPTKL